MEGGVSTEGEDEVTFGFRTFWVRRGVACELAQARDWAGAGVVSVGRVGSGRASRRRWLRKAERQQVELLPPPPFFLCPPPPHSPWMVTWYCLRASPTSLLTTHSNWAASWGLGAARSRALEGRSLGQTDRQTDC